MWRYAKWTVWAVAAAIVAAFLHYVLPQNDVVRITNTYNRLTPIGDNAIFYGSPDAGSTLSSRAAAGAAGTETRDIRFIETIYPNGEVMIFRNEDTGWFWPPYFKWDSANLQAEATNAVSTAAAPEWYSVTHYGWRSVVFSIYPNAVSITRVDGPDARVFPWASVIILSLLAFVAFMIRRMWLQFRERMVDPALASVGDAYDRADARADAARGRLSRWLGTWRRPPPR